MVNLLITPLPDDGEDAELGCAWSVTSGPLSGPLGIRTELQGTIGERRWRDPSEAFWWEAWHDVRVMDEECHGEGYAESLEAALVCIGEVWARSPLAQADAYVPSRRSTFSERMAGDR